MASGSRAIRRSLARMERITGIGGVLQRAGRAPEQAFMVNFRVADLDAMLAQLRSAGFEGKSLRVVSGVRGRTRRLTDWLSVVMADDGMSEPFAAERRRAADLVARVERSPRTGPGAL
jgi:hypothetical protein